MRRNITILGTASVLVLPIAAHAQGPIDTSELWLTAAVTGKLSDHVLGLAELSIRPSDTGVRAPTQLARVALGYQISKPVSLWISYVRNVQRPEGRPTFNENRIVEQLTWNIGKKGPGTLAARTRLEQRTVEGRRDTGWRLREQLRYTLPIKHSKTSLALSIESFFALNSTDWGASAGLDQWRTAIGLNIPLSKRYSLDVSYVNRYLRRSGARDRLDNIVPITLTYRF